MDITLTARHLQIVSGKEDRDSPGAPQFPLELCFSFWSLSYPVILP